MSPFVIMLILISTFMHAGWIWDAPNPGDHIRPYPMGYASSGISIIFPTKSTISHP